MRGDRFRLQLSRRARHRRRELVLRKDEAAARLQRDDAFDVFELRPGDPWPADYDEMVAWASRLRESEADVTLAEDIGDLDRYRTVFLGFPVWGTALPAVTGSFLRSHDLSGKTVVPFITYGSSSEGSSTRTVRALAPDARFVEPFVLRCDQERSTLDSLDAWLEGVGETLRGARQDHEPRPEARGRAARRHLHRCRSGRRGAAAAAPHLEPRDTIDDLLANPVLADFAERILRRTAGGTTPRWSSAR